MKKKIFISGNFNIIHSGHIRLFKYAKELADHLIVGVNGDKITPNFNLLSEKLRYEGVKSISFVDEVIICNTSVDKLILKIKPNLVLKGKEYENYENIEQKAVDKINSKLIFSSGDSHLSSTTLIRDYAKDLLNQEIEIKTEFLKRNNISRDNIINTLNIFKNKKVCVIGDIIVDRYINCESLGMSQEEPLVSMKPVSSNLFVGGAGIVASHSSMLGAKTTFYSVLSNDQNAIFVRNKLKEFGVKTKIFKDENRVTSLKTRYIHSKKTIFKTSELNSDSIGYLLKRKIIESLSKNMNKFDVLIFSDFNYGVLPDDLVKELILIAKKNKVLIAADSQSSSQIGDLLKYKNCDLILPTEREARITLRDENSGIIILTDKLRKILNFKYCILKLGSDGILINFYRNKLKITEKVQSLAKNVVDVAGAGDSLLVTSAIALSSSKNILVSSFLGSVAAAIQVSRLGNIPITKSEIYKVIENI